MTSTYKEDSNFSTIGFRSPDFLAPSLSAGMNSTDSAMTTDSIFRSAISHGYDKYHTDSNSSSSSNFNSNSNSNSRPLGPGDSVGSKLIRNLSLMQPDNNNYSVSKSLWGTNLNTDLNHTKNENDNENDNNKEGEEGRDRKDGLGSCNDSVIRKNNELDRMFELKTPPRAGRKRAADASPIGLLAALCEERNVSSREYSSHLSPKSSTFTPSFTGDLRPNSTQDSRQDNMRLDPRLDSRQDNMRIECSGVNPTQSTSDAAILLATLDEGNRDRNDDYNNNDYNNNNNNNTKYKSEDNEEEEEDQNEENHHQQYPDRIQESYAEHSMHFEQDQGKEKEKQKQKERGIDKERVNGSINSNNNYDNYNSNNNNKNNDNNNNNNNNNNDKKNDNNNNDNNNNNSNNDSIGYLEMNNNKSTLTPTSNHCDTSQTKAENHSNLMTENLNSKKLEEQSRPG